jgi:hypothetical protein
MVFDCGLVALGQQQIEMASSARWVLTRTKSFGLGCLKNMLNSATQPRCGLRFAAPDRLKHREHIFCFDCIQRKIPKRLCLGCQRVAPLLAVLRVLEPAFNVVDKIQSEWAKRRCILPLLRFALMPRVFAIEQHSAHLGRLLARHCQGNVQV